MPICLCSHCSHSHKVPTKNLGLQGRCKGCGELFLLVVEPAVQPPPAAAPKFESHDIPNPLAATANPPVVRATPVPPPPPPPPTLPPQPPVEEDEFNWSQPLDEIDDLEDEDASEEVPLMMNGKRASIPQGRGEVAPLPMRPALKVIETVLLACGVLCLAFAGVVLLLGLYGLAMNLADEREAVIGILILMAPMFGGGLLSATVLIALSELIAVLRALEARQHEISRNAELR